MESAPREPGDTFPFSCPRLTAHKAFPPPPERAATPPIPPLGLHFTPVPSRECRQAGTGDVVTRRGAPFAAASHCPLLPTHFAIHKQRQLQRESGDGQWPGRGGSRPGGAHWLRPLALGRLTLPSNPVPR